MAPDSKASDSTPETRADYPHIAAIQTRWADNDIYGHVNNVTYYAYFDTVVNCYLIEEGGLDIQDGTVVGFAVETTCRLFKPGAYPEKLAAGLRVAKLGNSSVCYEIAVFKEGEDEAAAAGRFVHVFVDRTTDRPTPIPAKIRDALEKLLVGGAA